MVQELNKRASREARMRTLLFGDLLPTMYIYLCHYQRRDTNDYWIHDICSYAWWFMCVFSPTKVRFVGLAGTQWVRWAWIWVSFMPFMLRNLCQLWIPDNARAGGGAYTYSVLLHNRLYGSSGPLSWFFCTVLCQLIWAHSWERLHFPKTASVKCYVMKISVCRAVLMALAALLCPADSTVTARHHSVSSGVWGTRSTQGMAWETVHTCDVLEWDIPCTALWVAL